MLLYTIRIQQKRLKKINESRWSSTWQICIYRMNNEWRHRPLCCNGCIALERIQEEALQIFVAKNAIEMFERSSIILAALNWKLSARICLLQLWKTLVNFLIYRFKSGCSAVVAPNDNEHQCIMFQLYYLLLPFEHFTMNSTLARFGVFALEFQIFNKSVIYTFHAICASCSLYRLHAAEGLMMAVVETSTYEKWIEKETCEESCQ